MLSDDLAADRQAAIDEAISLAKTDSTKPVDYLEFKGSTEIIEAGGSLMASVKVSAIEPAPGEAFSTNVILSLPDGVEIIGGLVGDLFTDDTIQLLAGRDFNEGHAAYSEPRCRLWTIRCAA